jgi:hypothetical protein
VIQLRRGSLPSAHQPLSDLSGLAVTPARVLWRHWPVLVSLSAAGLVARVALVDAAAYLAGISPALGLAVLMLAPLAVLAALVLMLRLIRPSLPLAPDEPPPAIAHLGSLLIPFVVFYLAFGLVGDDHRRYTGRLLGGQESPLTQVGTSGATLILLGLVLVAYGVRFLLTGWGRPRLTGLAAYLETAWVTLGLLYVVRPSAISAWSWVEQRAAWHWLVAAWDSMRGATGLRTANGWLVDAIPAGFVTAIFVVPLAALVTACAVLGVRGPQPASTRPQGIRQHRDGGPPTHPYQPLVAGLRAVRRTGAVPLMLFCLAVVVLETALPWLRFGEARLIGPYEPDSLVVAYQPSIDVANGVVGLVMLVCLLAGGAELVARHQVAPVRAAEPDPEAKPAMPTAPPPQWPLPQPTWTGEPAS